MHYLIGMGNVFVIYCLKISTVRICHLARIIIIL